jgi:hypothetical protein
MSTHRGAPTDPRTPPAVPDAGSAEGSVTEAPALRWDGATPPPLPAVDDATVRCHACEAEITGEPAGHGLLVFPRGDDVTREEPPLCERCALAIGVTALWGFADDDEEG